MLYFVRLEVMHKKYTRFRGNSLLSSFCRKPTLCDYYNWKLCLWYH